MPTVKRMPPLAATESCLPITLLSFVHRAAVRERGEGRSRRTGHGQERGERMARINKRMKTVAEGGGHANPGGGEKPPTRPRSGVIEFKKAVGQKVAERSLLLINDVKGRNS